MNFELAFAPVRRFDTALDVLAEQAIALGFDAVDYGYVPAARTASGMWISPPVIGRHLPSGWDRLWHRYSTHDPYYHACYRRNLALDWREVREAAWLSDIQRQCIAYLDDVGFRDAMTVPIHLSGTRFAFVTLSVQRSDYRWDQLKQRGAGDALLLAHTFQHWVCEHTPEKLSRRPLTRLSAREVECLRWAAASKTAPETALILGRSVETVRRHLKKAMSKLDAGTLAGAVARAGACGLIEFSS